MALIKAKIRVGHSPDPDDAFMFYAIAHDKIKTDGITFSHVIEDIERLNLRALKAELEVTAVSAFSFFEIADRYALMSCGASIGENYGPVLVANRSLYPKELEGKIAQVVQKGCLLHDRLITPAKVLVGTHQSTEEA